MTNFPIIDVALGLVFTYLTLSLVITATNELIASVLSRRQKTLVEGIKNLLGDELADALYLDRFGHDFSETALCRH